MERCPPILRQNDILCTLKLAFISSHKIVSLLSYFVVFKRLYDFSRRWTEYLFHEVRLHSLQDSGTSCVAATATTRPKPACVR